ncbi:hypothetical protein HCA63_06600 [Listeria booriae]|uniref:hypothetical protein n=1 Tax=Listeria booriae TaxID=1552123 RepID=UPI0016252873|nr:hypothetical protein [Listeria booriae]MBC1888018.1 hypothetical protein [Listeria booriae]
MWIGRTVKVPGSKKDHGAPPMRTDKYGNTTHRGVDYDRDGKPLKKDVSLGNESVITGDHKGKIMNDSQQSSGKAIPINQVMNYEGFKNGDIVGVYAWDSFCGMPKGYQQGIVVDLKGEEKPVIAFTDVALSMRADAEGTWQFLNFEAWDNCNIVLLYRCNNS